MTVGEVERQRRERQAQAFADLTRLQTVIASLDQQAEHVEPCFLCKGGQTNWRHKVFLYLPTSGDMELFNCWEAMPFIPATLRFTKRVNVLAGWYQIIGSKTLSSEGLPPVILSTSGSRHS